MPSARLNLADLEFVADAVSDLRRIALAWSSRETYTVTASNPSAQSPSIRVVRNFEANSIADFAMHAPRGKIYIMEARFESSEGAAVLTLGKDRELDRNLLLSFEGIGEAVPSWFDEIVKEIVSAKLMNAGMRVIYLVMLTWVPVLLPPIAASWAIASGRWQLGVPALLFLYIAGFAWFVYAIFAPTIVRFIRASSLRVTPLFGAVPQPVALPSPSRLVPMYFRELRQEARVALKAGWLTFRQSDHQFNAVLISAMALIVATLALLLDFFK